MPFLTPLTGGEEKGVVVWGDEFAIPTEAT